MNAQATAQPQGCDHFRGVCVRPAPPVEAREPEGYCYGCGEFGPLFYLGAYCDSCVAA
jgi:hypothetical protein